MKSSFARVISNINFRLLWYSQIISQIALNTLTFVLAIEVYRLTLSNTAVSLMMLTFGLPAIFFGVAFGGIVDKYDKRLILLISNLLRAAFLILFYFSSAYLLMLYFLSILVSIATQLFIPAEAPSIPQIVRRQDLLSANSLFTITFYLSIVLGSILAGPSLRILGSKNVYLLISLTLLLAAYFNYRMARLTPAKNSDIQLNLKAFINPIKEGFLFIHHHPRIRQSLFLLTFSQALIATLVVLAPGFAHIILELPIEDVSMVVMGPAALGLILGALTVGIVSKYMLRGSIILVGIVTTGVSLVILSVAGPLNYHGMIYVVMLMLVLIGISNSYINIPTSTILQMETDRDLRGRIYGILTSLTGGISVLPVLFSGILADTFGIDKTMLIIGLIVLSTGFYYLSKRKKLASLPSN